MHIPNYMSADSNIVIYGHTHEFFHEYKNNTLFINPGEICAREKPISQCVLLEVSNEKFVINYFYKMLLEKNTWELKQFFYNR